MKKKQKEKDSTTTKSPLLQKSTFKIPRITEFVNWGARWKKTLLF